MTVNGSGACTNGFFGSDPLPGTVKSCQIPASAPPPTGADYASVMDAMSLNAPAISFAAPESVAMPSSEQVASQPAPAFAAPLLSEPRAAESFMPAAPKAAWVAAEPISAGRLTSQTAPQMPNQVEPEATAQARQQVQADLQMRMMQDDQRAYQMSQMARMEQAQRSQIAQEISSRNPSLSAQELGKAVDAQLARMSDQAQRREAIGQLPSGQSGPLALSLPQVKISNPSSGDIDPCEGALSLSLLVNNQQVNWEAPKPEATPLGAYTLVFAHSYMDLGLMQSDPLTYNWNTSVDVSALLWARPLAQNQWGYYPALLMPSESPMAKALGNAKAAPVREDGQAVSFFRAHQVQGNALAQDPQHACASSQAKLLPVKAIPIEGPSA